MSNPKTKVAPSARIGLLDRLDELSPLLNELRWKLRRGKSPNGEVDADETSVIELIDALERIVRGFVRFIRPLPQPLPPNMTTIDMQKLTRTLLLTGQGGRFEPAVLLAIREYRTAYDNVGRYAAAELPETLKQDLLARFRQQLDSAAQALEILDVSVFEPQLHQPVVENRHRVTRVVESDDPQLVHCIAGVKSPGFEWHDEGTLRVEPARVLVYGSVKEEVPPKVMANGSSTKESRPPITKTTNHQPKHQNGKGGQR